MVHEKQRTRRRSRCTRFRIGRVSIYFHHGAWWVYYRQGEKQVRGRIGDDRAAVERLATEINAQLTVAAPTMFNFRPIGIPELCQEFLQYHDQELRSSLATIGCNATAIRHLDNYAASLSRPPAAHEISSTGFVSYLRTQRISPNGHAKAAPRPLCDKGVQFILETCRSMYGFLQRQLHLPLTLAIPSVTCDWTAGEFKIASRSLPSMRKRSINSYKPRVIRNFASTSRSPKRGCGPASSAIC